MTNEMQDYNRRVIEEFRANGGRVGGPFEGAPMLLLTTTGARSAARTTTPLVYLDGGERTYVFASMGGAPRHPAWYHNLVAHPGVTVEIGDRTVEMHATEVTGEERDAIYARQAERFPQFAEYQQRTTRRIPVLALAEGGRG